MPRCSGAACREPRLEWTKVWAASREWVCARFERTNGSMCKVSSPERIVDDGESELEILDDPVDPSVS